MFWMVALGFNGITFIIIVFLVRTVICVLEQIRKGWNLEPEFSLGG